MMQLNCKVNAEDFEKCQVYIVENLKREKNKNLPYRIFNGILAGSLVYFLLQLTPYNDADSYLMLLAGFLFIASFVMLFILRKRDGLKTWYQSLSGDYIWEFNAAGLSVKILANTDHPIQRNAFYAWPKVLAVTEDVEAWYVYVARSAAVRIPKRANTKHPATDLIVQASKYWAEHPDNFGLRLQTTAPQAVPQKNFWFDLRFNITNGLKVAFFIKVHPLAFKVRLSQLFGLILLDAATIALFDYLNFYPSAEFNAFGLPDYIASQFLFLLACIVITTLLYSQAWLLRLMVMISASMLAPSIIYMSVLRALPTNNHTLLWSLWAVYIAWGLLVVFRCIYSLFQLPKPVTAYLVAFYTFIALALNGLFIQQEFFHKNYSDDEEYKPPIDEESVYYQQPQLIENMLRKLAPQRAGVTDLYYLGVAGYGYQKVFSNEVKYAQDLFDKKFDTENRSALLINHESTVNNIPLANSHNLANALNGIAKKMDVNNDILFLFLSSHGSRTFEISVSLYPFEMRDISATDVKKMLDASGIKNRVIAISACYSGGFIDTLKDENTLILTAASKDRTSFGCSDDAEFTYFGKAYFTQALQREKSFTQAFEDAKVMISTREKAEQKDDKPSLPQMFEGSAIKEKLETWQKSLH